MSEIKRGEEKGERKEEVGERKEGPWGCRRGERSSLTACVDLRIEGAGSGRSGHLGFVKHHTEEDKIGGRTLETA